MTIKSIRRRDGAIPGGLTAENVMDRNCLVIPQQMLVREAVRLLHQKQSKVAVVVGANGKCAGTLRMADVVRWIDADCPKAVVGVTCPYQVRGRLLNGDEALICALSHGSCGYQSEIPTTGGRHTEVCTRQESAKPPFGATPGYMTTCFGEIGPQSSLCEIVQHIVDTGLDELIVIDNSGCPAGIVSASDVLTAIVDRMPKPDETSRGRDQSDELHVQVKEEFGTEAGHDERPRPARPHYLK
jgi:CBS-domain-containing membrane protein